MKVFFDWFIDLFIIEQDLGWQFRGKVMVVIVVFIGNNLGEDFWLFFLKIVVYLGMEYWGYLYIFVDEFWEEELNWFLNSLGS